MSWKGNNINLLKQVPFYGKTIKSKLKNLLTLNYYELPFFKKPIKPKTKQLSIKKLLSD